MSIRLLGGRAKSFSLQVPSGQTRPTSVILRRKIFDSHQNLSGVTFIDCCAGTGAMGFEAWSRGSDEIVLIEASKHPQKILKDNARELMRKFNIKPEAIKLVSQDCMKWLDFNDLKQMENFILFFDPPYADHQLYWDFLKKLNSFGALSGHLWIESDEQKGIKLSQLTHLGLSGFRQYTHGTSYLCHIPLENGLNLSF